MSVEDSTVQLRSESAGPFEAGAARDLSFTEADVVVVGAGLAGLIAARDVIAAGHTAVVLEARDRVGGRLLSVEIGDGKILDVGGQWVGPTQDRVLALARELGIETFSTHTDGENLVELDGEVRRYRAGTKPRINDAALADLLQAQSRLDQMALTLPAEAPWGAPCAEEWDGRFKTPSHVLAHNYLDDDQ